MSAYEPQTSKMGNIPHLSFVTRKPQPLGSEFKCCCDTVTNMMIHIELQKGREAMLLEKYASSKKPTVACVLRMSEDTSRPHNEDCFGKQCDAPTETFLGDSWFSSVQAAIEMRLRGKHYIGVVKTNSSGYPKAFLEDKMKDYPAGSHLILETTTKEEIDLLAIGYKYNRKKVMFFIATNGSGHTEEGIPYEARWKDKNNNTRVRKVFRPEIVAKYFTKSNSIDVHNQSRQFDLRLEKCWLTHCGFFRIITTIFGICVTDCWNAYRYHIDHRNPHKDRGICKFAAIVAKDCLNNSFSKDPPSNVASLSIGVSRKQPQQNKNDDVTFNYVRENSTLDDQSILSALTSSLSSPHGTNSSKSSRTPKNNIRDCFHGHNLVQCQEMESYYKRDREDKPKPAERRKRVVDARSARKRLHSIASSVIQMDPISHGIVSS